MSRVRWILGTLLSHWRRHPAQFATLMIGLISATALWSGVQALNQQARDSYDRAAATFGGARTATLVGMNATFPQRLFVDLRRAGWMVSPVVEGRISIDGRPVRLLGVEPLTMPQEARSAPALDRAGLQAFLTPPGETLAAPETMRDLHLKEGQRFALSDGFTLPPLHTQPQLAPGVFVVDIGVAQRLLKKPDMLSRLIVGRSDVSHASLPSIVGDQLRLVEADTESDLERLTDSFHLNLTAFGLLSFLVGLFIVNSAVGLAFEQRMPMLRTLRACGVSARELNATLVLELVALSLMAGAIGLICGYLVAAALLPDVAASLRGLYGAPVPGELTLKPQWWIAGFTISIDGALAAAATNLIKAARLPVLATAQPQAWRQAQQRWLIRQGILSATAAVAALCLWQFGDSLVAGFGLLAALLLAAALGLPVVLGLVLASGERGARAGLAEWFWADSRQQLGGLSLALMALLLALAVNVGVGTMVESFSRTFLNWLDGRLSSDVYITARDEPQARQIETWLRQRPEVQAILPGARQEIQLGDWPVELLGLPDDAVYRAQWPLLETTPAAWDRLRTGTSAFISEQLSRRLKLGIGDHIVVPLTTGEWRLDIVGVYADYGNPKGQVSVDVAALLGYFPNTPQTRFGLRVTQGATAGLISGLQSTFDLDDRGVIDQASLKTESKRIFNRTFSVTAALNTFTLGVAGIALLTSLLTLSQARLPQLAPLWAIGVTRQRLASIELLKTMAVALITALVALPVGLLVAWCLIAVVNVKAFGWRLPFQYFPLQLATLMIIAVAAAGIAALWPAIKLARTQPDKLIKVFANER